MLYHFQMDEEGADVLRSALDYYSNSVHLSRTAAAKAASVRGEVARTKPGYGLVICVDDDVDQDSFEVVTSSPLSAHVAIVKKSDATDRALLPVKRDTRYVSRVMAAIKTDKVLGSLQDALKESLDRLEHELGTANPDRDATLQLIQSLYVRLQEAEQQIESINREHPRDQQSDNAGSNGKGSAPKGKT